MYTQFQRFIVTILCVSMFLQSCARPGFEVEEETPSSDVQLRFEQEKNSGTEVVVVPTKGGEQGTNRVKVDGENVENAGTEVVVVPTEGGEQGTNNMKVSGENVENDGSEVVVIPTKDGEQGENKIKVDGGNVEKEENVENGESEVVVVPTEGGEQGENKMKVDGEDVENTGTEVVVVTVEDEEKGGKKMKVDGEEAAQAEPEAQKKLHSRVERFQLLLQNIVESERFFKKPLKRNNYQLATTHAVAALRQYAPQEEQDNMLEKCFGISKEYAKKQGRQDTQSDAKKKFKEKLKLLKEGEVTLKNVQEKARFFIENKESLLKNATMMVKRLKELEKDEKFSSLDEKNRDKKHVGNAKIIMEGMIEFLASFPEEKIDEEAQGVEEVEGEQENSVVG